MKPIAVLSIALVMSAPTYAQLNRITIPTTEFPGGKNQKSDQFGTSFGAFAGQRILMRESGLMGGVRAIKSVGVRRSSAGTQSNQSRTWNNVTLALFGTTLQNNSKKFADHYGTAPKQVFSGAVSWPATTGALQSPYAFPPETSFPFQGGGVYLDAGTVPLGLEFVFSGGTLASGTWGTKHRPYHLDAPNPADYGRSKQYFYGGSTCSDTNTNGTCRTEPIFENRAKSLDLVIQSHGTGPNIPVLMVLDFIGEHPGYRNTKFRGPGMAFPGTPCGRVHVAASPLMMIFIAMSNNCCFAMDRSLKIPQAQVPPAAIGLEVWGQTIWNDSGGNGNLLLSNPGSSVIVGIPKVYPRRDSLYRNNPAPGNTEGDHWQHWDINYNPLMEYRYQ